MKLPDGWKKVRLEKVSHIQTGIAKNQNNSEGTIEVPYLRVANVQDGYLDLFKIKTIQIQESKIDRYKLEIGDVLLTEGGDFDKLGRGTVWSGEIKNCIHQNHVFAVRPDIKIILPNFLSALSGSTYGKKYFLSCSKQSTNLASINSSQLKAFPVLLPPLPEQKAIADFLSAWDEAIEKTQRLIQAREKWFRVLLRQLISDNGQLTTGNSSADDADSRRWKKVKLGDMFGKEIFINKGKALTKRNIQDGNIPVVAGGQTYAYFTNIATHEYPTITISASGAYAGFVWYHDYPIWASDCNVLFAYNGSTLFYYYALKILQHRIYALQSGGAQPHIYAKDLKNLYISNPSLEEQKQIAETLSTAQQGIDLLKQLAEKYKTQKRGLMQKLLTGDWRIKPEILNKYKEA